jgi:hypothetical protein
LKNDHSEIAFEVSQDNLKNVGSNGNSRQNNLNVLRAINENDDDYHHFNINGEQNHNHHLRVSQLSADPNGD